MPSCLYRGTARGRSRGPRPTQQRPRPSGRERSRSARVPLPLPSSAERCDAAAIRPHRWNREMERAIHVAMMMMNMTTTMMMMMHSAVSIRRLARHSPAAPARAARAAARRRRWSAARGPAGFGDAIETVSVGERQLSPSLICRAQARAGGARLAATDGRVARRVARAGARSRVIMKGRCGVHWTPQRELQARAARSVPAGARREPGQRPPFFLPYREKKI